jgi:hypothetical protein
MIGASEAVGALELEEPAACATADGEAPIEAPQHDPTARTQRAVNPLVTENMSPSVLL